MNSKLTSLLIWVAVIGVTFIAAWKKGYIARLSVFVQETREELRPGRCTWPTWTELKGSTVLVMVAMVLLGGFTMGTDFVFSLFAKLVSSLG